MVVAAAPRNAFAAPRDAREEQIAALAKEQLKTIRSVPFPAALKRFDRYAADTVKVPEFKRAWRWTAWRPAALT